MGTASFSLSLLPAPFHLILSPVRTSSLLPTYCVYRRDRPRAQPRTHFILHVALQLIDVLRDGEAPNYWFTAWNARVDSRRARPQWKTKFTNGTWSFPCVYLVVTLLVSVIPFKNNEYFRFLNFSTGLCCLRSSQRYANSPCSVYSRFESKLVWVASLLANSVLARYFLAPSPLILTPNEHVIVEAIPRDYLLVNNHSTASFSSKTPSTFPRSWPAMSQRCYSSK